VSRRFFPLTRTMSPRKNWSRSMVAVERASTELSSLVASSTISLLGAFFLRRIAVAGSCSGSALGATIEAFSLSTSSSSQHWSVSRIERIAPWWVGRPLCFQASFF
jgi:hypothetical protein